MRRLVILICLIAGTSWSATVYDNGPPNQFDGSEMTSFLQAEDFTFPVISTFDSIRFWTLEDAVSFSGSIFWAIYSDSSGAPGSVLFSAEGVPVGTPTGFPGLSLDEFVYTLAIPGITLPTGTYWLALHNGPLSNNGGAQMFWETADANANANLGKELLLPNGTWESNFFEHAFQLQNSDIPEPGTIVLGLTALALLGAARRHLTKISGRY